MDLVKLVLNFGTELLIYYLKSGENDEMMRFGADFASKTDRIEI